MAYDSNAVQKGWPVGKMFAADVSMIKIASFIGLPFSAIAAAYLAVWWSAVAVIIVGFFVALLLINFLHSYVQPLSIIGLATCWVLGITMLAQA